MWMLVVVIAALIVVAGALFVAMFRRERPMLGLAGLAVTLAAAAAALLYGGLDSL